MAATHGCGLVRGLLRITLHRHVEVPRHDGDLLRLVVVPEVVILAGAGHVIAVDEQVLGGEVLREGVDVDVILEVRVEFGVVGGVHPREQIYDGLFILHVVILGLDLELILVGFRVIALVGKGAFGVRLVEDAVAKAGRVVFVRVLQCDASERLAAIDRIREVRVALRGLTGFGGGRERRRLVERRNARAQRELGHALVDAAVLILVEADEQRPGGHVAFVDAGAGHAAALRGPARATLTTVGRGGLLSVRGHLHSCGSLTVGILTRRLSAARHTGVAAESAQGGVALETHADILDGRAVNRDVGLHPGLFVAALVVLKHGVDGVLVNIEGNLVGLRQIKKVGVVRADVGGVVEEIGELRGLHGRGGCGAGRVVRAARGQGNGGGTGDDASDDLCAQGQALHGSPLIRDVRV